MTVFAAGWSGPVQAAEPMINATLRRRPGREPAGLLRLKPHDVGLHLRELSRRGGGLPVEAGRMLHAAIGLLPLALPTRTIIEHEIIHAVQLAVAGQPTMHRCMPGALRPSIAGSLRGNNSLGSGGKPAPIALGCLHMGGTPIRQWETSMAHPPRDGLDPCP